MAFCGNCGTQLPEGTKFCPNCGTTVGMASQQNNQSSQQTYQSAQQPYQASPQQAAYEPQPKEGFFRRLFHNKWFWIVFGIICVGIAASRMNYSDRLEKDVKAEMVKKAKEEGHTLVVKDFALVKESENSHIYSGLAKCTLDGEPIDLDVEVVCDGKKWTAHWAPTDEYLLQNLEDLWDDALEE